MDITLTAFEKLGPNMLFELEFYYNDNCFLVDALLNLHIYFFIRYNSKNELVLSFSFLYYTRKATFFGMKS